MEHEPSTPTDDRNENTAAAARPTTGHVASATSRRFRTLTFMLVGGLAIAVLGAAAGGGGPGVLTVQQAIFGLALATLVTAGVLAIVLVRLSSVFDELRSVRQETTIIRHHMSAAEEKQHVITIEGIGEKYASRLNSVGIITVPQLLRSDASEVANLIDTTRELVAEWQAMGRLMQVKGIGPQYAELLVRCGITTVAELARSDPQELAQRIELTQASRKVAIQRGEIGPRTVERWTRAAADHLAEAVVKMA